MAGVLAVEEAEIVDGEVVDEPLDGECQLVEGEVISGVSPIGIIDRLPRDLEHRPLPTSPQWLMNSKPAMPRKRSMDTRLESMSWRCPSSHAYGAESAVCQPNFLVTPPSQACPLRLAL